MISPERSGEGDRGAPGSGAMSPSRDARDAGAWNVDAVARAALCDCDTIRETGEHWDFCAIRAHRSVTFESADALVERIAATLHAALAYRRPNA